MVGVLKNELENVFHNFQKEKIPSLSGIPIELYLEWYDFLGEEIL